MKLMMEQNKKSHHVAWSDRIGINKTWAKAIERIWATWGTDEFFKSVWGFRCIIINIKNGPQLRTIIDTYIAELEQKKNIKLESYRDTYAYGSENDILTWEMLDPLAYFMVQLLEDNGFGFYESNIEEDEMS